MDSKAVSPIKRYGLPIVYFISLYFILGVFSTLTVTAKITCGAEGHHSFLLVLFGLITIYGFIATAAGKYYLRLVSMEASKLPFMTHVIFIISLEMPGNKQSSHAGPAVFMSIGVLLSLFCEMVTRRIGLHEKIANKTIVSMLPQIAAMIILLLAYTGIEWDDLWMARPGVQESVVALARIGQDLEGGKVDAKNAASTVTKASELAGDIGKKAPGALGESWSKVAECSKRIANGLERQGKILDQFNASGGIDPGTMKSAAAVLERISVLKAAEAVAQEQLDVTNGCMGELLKMEEARRGEIGAQERRRYDARVKISKNEVETCQAMLNILRLLLDSWGGWRVEGKDGTVLFDEDALVDKYNQLISKLNELISERDRLNEHAVDEAKK